MSALLVLNAEAKSLEACASKSIVLIEKFHNDINFWEKFVTRYYGDEIKNDEESFTLIKHKFMGIKYRFFH